MQQPLQVVHAPCPQCNGPAVFRLGRRSLAACVLRSRSVQYSKKPVPGFSVGK